MWTTLRRSAAFWFGLCFLIAAGGMTPVVLSERATYKALLAAGQCTDAAILDGGERPDGDKNSSHWVKLKYVDFNSQEHIREQPVSKELWTKYPVGSTARVRYLRENPGTVKLESKMPKPEWKDLLTITITVFGIGAAIVSLAAIKARRATAVH
jgi:hypothetical protein